MNIRIKTLLSLSVFLTACSITPSTTNLEIEAVSEKQQVNCNASGNPDEMEQAYPALLEMKWDREAFSCGALYAYELAASSWFGVERKAEALGAQITYLDILSRQYPRLYQSGELAEELRKEWFATKFRASELVAQLEKFEWLAAEIPLLHGAYLLTSVEKEANVKEQFAVVKPARALIEQSVRDKPEALGGLGYLILGRLSLSLPSFYGGNTKEAIRYLETGIEIAPESLEMHRWLIEAYLAERRSEDAATTLRTAASITDESMNPQDRVDIFSDIGGLAERLGLVDIARHFSAERQQLLGAHPYLLTRKYHASLGHGGTDPLTGKDSNEI